MQHTIARGLGLLLLMGLLLGLLVACPGGFGRPPKGAQEERSSEDKAAIARVRSQVDGLIVWSSSRAGNHDLYLMKTDGSDVKRLTQGKHVDWYPRFGPKGQRILFTRSIKPEWVSEKDANRPEKWALYVMPVGGGTPELVVQRASWGEWVDSETILFARKTQVVRRELSGGKEQVLVDSTKVSALGGAELQNPHLSPNGKYLAITLRGAMRETGVFNLESQSWAKTGLGCQINWFPSGDRILWINPSGNGGSQTFSIPLTDGRPAKEYSEDEIRLIDIPGRRSHEYFPQLDRSGKWLVWAATRRGHDHDIADYEIYIWKVGAPPEHAARLTYHSGNDRWPDISVISVPAR